MKKTLNILFKYSIYTLVFLLPLFWLSFTVEGHEFNKQYLFVVLAAVAGLAWLARQIVVRQKISLRRVPLNIWVIVFLTTVILSGVFSLDSVSSWLGFYGRFSGALVCLISACLLYFLVVNGIGPVKSLASNGIKSKVARAETIILLTIASGWIVVISAWCAVLGVFEGLEFLPRAMKLRSFNLTSGSIEGLAVYLIVLVSVLIGVLAGRKEIASSPRSAGFLAMAVGAWKDRLALFSHVLLLVSAVILLALINFGLAWLVLGVTMLLFLAVALWTGAFRKRVNVLVPSIFLVLLAGFYLSGIAAQLGILNAAFSLSGDLPREVSLTHRASWDVVQGALKSDKANLLFGTGPGTFFTDFVKYKPVEINQTSAWNIRFDKPSSHAIEMLAASGVVGAGGYALLILVFTLILFFALKKFRRDSISNERTLAGSPLFWPVLLGWIAVFAAQFIYVQNTVLLFYFWLFTALLAGLWWSRSAGRKKLQVSFKKMPEVGLVANVVLLVLVVVVVGLFYLGGRFYWADVVFAGTFSQEEDELISASIENVVSLNGYRENYHRILSQSYLIDAWREANKAEEERNLPVLQALVSGAIGQARRAIQLNENNVTAWENLGVIYRDSRGLVGGAIPFSLAAFTRASELEPTNPVFFRERCWLNLISEEKDWEETVSYCQKAIELKPNYLDAHLQLALAFEGKGDLEKALRQMESALEKIKGVSFQRGSAMASAASEIYFQMGRLHFNLENFDGAAKMFQQSIVISPNYANAHYALGLVLRAQGFFSEALTSFAKVNQLVPGNETVRELIKELEAYFVQPQAASDEEE